MNDLGKWAWLIGLALLVLLGLLSGLGVDLDIAIVSDIAVALAFLGGIFHLANGDRTRKLGVQLVGEGDSRPSSAPARPYLSEKPTPKAQPSAPAAPSGGELQDRVYGSVKARLGDQVDETLLKAIVQRVLKNVGRK